MSPAKRASIALAGGIGVSAAAAAIGFLTTQAFVLRRRSILLAPAPAISPEQSRSLRILHLSDIHLLTSQKDKVTWIQKLADAEPDFLVLTGDQLSEGSALQSLLEALEPFAGIPGAFVFGSHDYHSPHAKNPISYLLDRNFVDPHADSSDEPSEVRDLPWEEMTAAFEAAGWINLNNRRAKLSIGNWNVALVGVDDPHIALDEFPPPDPAYEWEPSDSSMTIKIGLAHAPYQAVLDTLVDDGCDFVFAGHTHGGQIRVPKVGALITNCDLDRKLASGLFQWPPTGKAAMTGDGSVARYGERGKKNSWVNVSAGLGSSPYAPVRIACRPEAIQVDLITI